MKTLLKTIKEALVHYLQLRLKTLRLEVVERIANVMGYFIFILVVIFLFFFAFLFFSFGLAAWLGDILHSRYGGMFCTGGIILVLAIIIVLTSKPFIRFFAGKVAGILTRKVREEEEDDD